MKRVLIPILFVIAACHSHSNMPDGAYYKEVFKKQEAIGDSFKKANQMAEKTIQASSTDIINKNYVNYKIGSYLILGAQGMLFEVINKNLPPKKRITKGDTLINDGDTLILGDFKRYQYGEFYKKYVSKFTMPMFKVNENYKGKLAKPDFSGCPKDFRYDKDFRATIKEGCNDGINFAGHYTIVEISCGCECAFMYLIDRINGKLYYKLPMDTADGYYGAKYNKNSKMVIVNSGLIDDCNDSSDHYLPGYRVYNNYAKPKVYVWKGSVFKKIE